MKQLLFAALGLFVLSATSCASIVSRSNYPVHFETIPEEADIAIENRAGRIVFEGHTPVTVPLEASESYMRGEIYRVTFRHPEREPVVITVEARLDGWYFGNILLFPLAGGVVGMLVIDPLTGAMYKLPENVFVNMGGEPVGAQQGLEIRNIDDLPEGVGQEWLVPLEK